MSYTFSRRAFLKYSAATAVAGAGASLLWPVPVCWAAVSIRIPTTR